MSARVTTSALRGALVRAAVSVGAAAAIVGLALVPARVDAAWDATTTGSGNIGSGWWGGDPPGSYPTHILASVAMMYLRLDDLSGKQATNYTDFLKEKNGKIFHGEYVNNPLLGLDPAVPGQTRYSVGFTGTQHIKVKNPGVDGNKDHDFDFPGVKDYGVEFWIKPTPRPTSEARPPVVQRIVAKMEDKKDVGWRGWSVGLRRTQDDGTLTIQFERQYGNALQATSYPLTMNQWHHVGVAFGRISDDDPGPMRMRIYIDGVLRATADSTFEQPSVGGDLMIGAAKNNTENLHAQLDEVAVYFYGLKQEQVVGHWLAATGS